MVTVSILQSIQQAVANGRLREPFSASDFREACPGWGQGTYNAWLWKHYTGNPGGYRSYVRRLAKGKFELIK